jgi:N-acetylmuramoyl-L-alanine amidase
MGTAQGAIDWLCNPKSQVSAHYVVDEQGQIYRLVAEDNRAWHAGVSHWDADNDVNSTSVGIEIVNPGDAPYPQVQMDAVAALCRSILGRHSIPADHVVGHSDVAPTRKQDPGEQFDWKFLASQNIGVWPVPLKQDYDTSSNWSQKQIREKLTEYGYNSHDSLEAIVTAFQRHFQPEAFHGGQVGVPDKETKARLACLLRRKNKAAAARAKRCQCKCSKCR